MRTVNMKFLITLIGFGLLTAFNLKAEDRLELETTFIKGNKELPQILYVVPWQDVKSKKKKEQQIVLFSLFGDLFDPVTPSDLEHKIIK